MNLKVRLLIIPSLAIASLLGACGSQETGEAPVEPGVVQEEEAGVVEPEVEEPGVLEGEEGVAEGETDVLEGEEGVAEGDTPLVEEEGVAAADTPVVSEEGVAAAETPVVSEEGVAAAETPAVAEEEMAEGDTTVTEPGIATEGIAGMEQFDPMSAVKASEIIGYDVENMADEDLGDIEDLLVDVNSGQVRYAILSFGGFLDIGDKLFAIPLNAINFNAEEQAFIFDVTEETLENAPGFERDNWPDTNLPDWDLGYQEFWLDTEANNQLAEDQAGVQGDETVTEDETVAEGQDQLQNPEAIAGGQVIRASELLDYNIHNAQDEEIGEVEDLIIQMNQPQSMAYAVLSLDEMFDETAITDDTVGEAGETAADDAAVDEADETAAADPAVAIAGEERFYAIPLNQLNLNNPEDGFFVFNADPQMLDTALSFSPEEWSQQMNLEDVN
jgi:sporulation protein YlmC with PRC-barrel domain